MNNISSQHFDFYLLVIRQTQDFLHENRAFGFIQIKFWFKMGGIKK